MSSCIGRYKPMRRMMAEAVGVRRKKTKKNIIKVGSKRDGRCWVCGAPCTLERLANGHDKHTYKALARGGIPAGDEEPRKDAKKYGTDSQG